MSYRARLILALSVIVTGGAAADPATVLTPHAAEYKVRVSGVSGRLTTRLERRGNGYEAVHFVEPTGFVGLFARGDVRERSSFEDFGDGLLPTSYESRNTLGEDSGAQLEFDWRDGRVTGMHYEDGRNTTVDAPLDTPLFDRLSIQYRLMADLASGDDEARESGDEAAPEDAGAIEGAPDPEPYILFDGEETRPLEITRIGEREIRTGAGTFATIGVQHQKQGSSRRTLLWLAPDLDYLPVLIEQYRREELKVRATLREYRPLED